MMNGKSNLKGTVAAAAGVMLLTSACSNDTPHASKETVQDSRIVVSSVSDSDKDAMCEAIQSGVAAYADRAPDASDEPPQGGQEYCYSIRGDGSANFVSGMLRVHEFTDDDIDKYATAIGEDEETNPSECFNYMKLAASKDQQFNPGPTSFSDTSEGGRDHCAASSDEAAIAAFTITGAVVVVEFNAVGQHDGAPSDVTAVADSILPKVFDAIEG